MRQTNTNYRERAEAVVENVAGASETYRHTHARYDQK